jgi:hypothetical protein
MVRINMLNDYLMINESTNIVENICTWDGNPDTWQPPTNYLMLIKDITPAMLWVGKKVEIQPPTDPITYEVIYVLEESMGSAEIGFIWNGTVCTTNEPEPVPPIPAENQPNAEGFTTI